MEETNLPFGRKLLLAVQLLHRKGFLVPPKCCTVGPNWRLELPGMLIYESNQGSKIPQLGIDGSQLTINQLTDLIIDRLRQKLLDYKPGSQQELFVRLWWFDRVLQVTAPYAIYSEFSDRGAGLVIAGTHDSSEGVPDVEEAFKYPEKHGGALHPFLLNVTQALQTKEGQSHFMMLKEASRNCNWVSVIKLIMANPKMYANAVHPASRTGFAPLHHAAQAGASPEVIHKLLSAGADPYKRSLLGTPIEIAKESKHAITLHAIVVSVSN